MGVFLRLAPSTMAIILSRKLCPASWVTRTTRQSESTVVPPVTAERSPPASRMTGADSPVTADSSTLAAPSTTSPSAGICSPAETRKKSPRLSAAPGTSATASRRAGSLSLWAVTSRLEERRESAWALPRPSAMASAKLEKRLVSHRITAMARVNPLDTRFSETPRRESAKSAVVRSAER